MKKIRKTILVAIVALIFLVSILLTIVFLGLNFKNKNNKSFKLSKENSQAIKTLNPEVCQQIKDEEKKEDCIENVAKNAEYLEDTNPVYLGSLLFQAGNYDEAISVYEKAVAEGNKYVDIRTYLSLASAYAEKGMMWHQEKTSFPKALEWANKAKELEPNNPQVYKTIGYIYEAKPDVISAIDNYDKALELDPFYIPAYIGRCHVHSLSGLLGRALEDCQKAVELDKEKKYPAGYLHLCRLQMSIEDQQDNAIQNCQVVLSSSGANENSKATACQILATIKMKLGNPEDEVLSLINQAILYAPQDPNNYLTLAVFYNKRNNFEKAKENAQKAIDMDAQKSVAFGELGYAQLKTNDLNKALENFNKAVDLIVKGQDPSLLASHREYYKNKYCENLKDVYQRKGQEFKKEACL